MNTKNWLNAEVDDIYDAQHAHYKCLTSNNANMQKLFLKLPSMLYDSDKCTQDIKIEKQLLTGKHVLSSTIQVFPFLIVDRDNMPISRCLMTYYENDPNAYVGFFESYDDTEAVQKMFSYVERKAKRDGKLAIVGPVDASFFINYRFKINLFDATPYTGEPYNREYYRLLWEESGFSTIDTFHSYSLCKIGEIDADNPLKKAFDSCVNNGCEFRSPDVGEFDICLNDMYNLLVETDLLSCGNRIPSEDQFMTMFAQLEEIIDYDMIKLAYQGNKLLAFSVAVPNYHTLVKKEHGLFKSRKVRQIRTNPKDYVLWHVCSWNDRDLTAAILFSILNELRENKCTAIGAMVKDVGIVDEVYKYLRRGSSYYYVLMTKQIH